MLYSTVSELYESALKVDSRIFEQLPALPELQFAGELENGFASPAHNGGEAEIYNCTSPAVGYTSGKAFAVRKLKTEGFVKSRGTPEVRWL